MTYTNEPNWSNKFSKVREACQGRHQREFTRSSDKDLVTKIERCSLEHSRQTSHDSLQSSPSLDYRKKQLQWSEEVEYNDGTTRKMHPGSDLAPIKKAEKTLSQNASWLHKMQEDPSSEFQTRRCLLSKEELLARCSM